MKIGVLTTSFPRAEGDAAGGFVLGFARALAARGHTLEVLAPEPGERAYTAPPREAGIEVRWLPYLRPRALEQTFYGAGVFDNVRAQPLAALGLISFTAALAASTGVSVRRWDALVSHWALPSGLVASELARGRPHLAVLHSGDVALLEQLPARKQLARRISRGATSLLLTSRDLRRRFLALLDPIERAEVTPKTHVCAMGIEPFAPSRETRTALRERLGLTAFTVLSLGRLVPIKGLEHAIGAAALADVELLIAGYGPERQALERLAKERGARVRFLGAVAGRTKSDWLRAADAFVAPSIVLANGRTEGMPNAVLEAMEHGLPVIASDVGGLRDVVRPGENGCLVAPGEPRAIAASLRELTNPSFRARLARGARATAAQYHWSELGPRFEALLFGECDERPPRV